MEYILYSSKKYMMFLMSSCKKKMDTLSNFLWEMFGKLMEYMFPTKNYIMYPLVRYFFVRTHQKHCVFLAGIQNVFHASSKFGNFGEH